MTAEEFRAATAAEWDGTVGVFSTQVNLWNIDILSVRQTGILPVSVAAPVLAPDFSGLQTRWGHRLQAYVPFSVERWAFPLYLSTSICRYFAYRSSPRFLPLYRSARSLL